MSNERVPTPNDESSPQWERLVSELRACKESQRQTWGDLDDLTLGRYLAGESSSAETARVEGELRQRAELRQLTELVRDVLGELGPAEVAPQPQTTPRVLSLEKAQARRRPVLDFLRRRSSLVAAACLLIVLGVAMPNPGFLSAPMEGLGEAPEPAVARRGIAAVEQVAAMAPPPPPAPPPRVFRGGGVPGPSSRAISRGKGKRLVAMPSHAPARPTLERVVALQREGTELRKRGDLVAAQGKFFESYFLCKDKLGEDHQATKNSACSLADVYALGLNAGPSEPVHLKMAPSRPETTVMAAADVKPPQTLVARASMAPGQAAAPLKAPPTRLDNLPVRKIKEQVVPVLAAALESAPSAEKRRMYLRALGELGSAAAPALPVLTKRLEDGADSDEIMAVVDTLRQLGTAADSAKPSVVKLRDKLQIGGEEKPRFKLSQVVRISRLAHELKGPLGRVGVDDAVGCFSLGALRDASKQLAQLARTKGVEVLVRTGPTDPARCARALKRMGPRAVCVAIDPEAPAVTVRLSEKLREGGFDAEGLRQRVLAACREGRLDQALAEGLQMIRSEPAREKSEKD